VINLPDGVGKPILCGKSLHPGLGCREKFEWGGSHGFDGDLQKNMTFRDVLPSVSGLTLDDLDQVGGYKPHPVSDGGVGSGGKRTLAEGDSGRRKLIVVDGEIAGAVLAFLPKKFVWFYEQLVDLGYGEKRVDGGSGRRRDDVGRSSGLKATGRLSSGHVDKTLTAATAGKTKNHAEIQFKNEKAVDFRRLVDRRLRRLAREIEEFLVEGSGKLRSGKRKCGGRCKKIGDPDWVYCPRCGGPMQEES
jgi:hypothetical protein